MKNRFIFFFIFLPLAINAQKFNSKYFEDSKWASSNKDKLFYKADTITLVKIIENTYSIDSKSMDVANYFNNNDYVTLEFYKNDSLDLFTTLIEGWSIYRVLGQYKWNFDKKEHTLNLCLNGKLFKAFIPIPGSEKETILKSQIIGNPDIRTIEIKLKRIYLP